jgi:protein HIRA/HIR1
LPPHHTTPHHTWKKAKKASFLKISITSIPFFEMLIEKPSWVKHENDDGHASAIYSIDVHPDGTRFATGGGDNHARIWSVAPVCSQEAQDNEKEHPKLLAIATRHDAAVNVVRWSHDGVYLATGSDDTNIIIWRCMPGVSALGNVENWCSDAMLQGHTSDVKDLGWSPNDDLLATCSIDNTVRVWRINESSLRQLRLNTPLVVLKGHTSWVRGLCWDPVGKYLASTSDDNSMIVWRTSDWKQEVVVDDPFRGAPTVSNVRRLDWSPDGKTICASHAFQHPRHVASIVERKDWTSDLNLVGHETAIGAVRFNDRLFSQTKVSSSSKKKKAAAHRACIAIGSQDATLSVWMAAHPRALAIVHKLFDAEISDLSWNSGSLGGNGLVLLACSLDGSVCCLQFEEDDLGDISSVSQTKERLKELYGASVRFSSCFRCHCLFCFLFQNIHLTTSILLFFILLL